MEKLPGNGILWRVDHGNGVICEWGDYDSLDDIRNAKGDKPAVDIRCPECGKMGKIGSIINDPVQKPDTYTYRIHHADDTMAIHAVKSEHRDIILKVLGRYIDSKPSYVDDAGPIEQSRRKRPHAKGWHRRKSQPIICVNCQKPGRSAGPTKSLNGYVSVYHKPGQPSGKPYYHLMKIDEWQKQVAPAAPTAPTPRPAPSLATLEWHVPVIDCPRCGKADGRAQKPRKQTDMYINHGSGSDSTSCHLNPLQTVSLLSYMIVSQSQQLEERDKTIAKLAKNLKPNNTA